MKTIILGLGNPILCDDSVGIRVAEAVEKQLNDPDVTVTSASVGGLGLLDLLVEHDRAIVIDAIQTKDGKPGQIRRFGPDSVVTTLNSSSVHDVNFTTALELGRRLGMALPQEIIIYGIEVEDVNTFSEKCTPEVEKAIPVCVARVLKDIGKT